MKSGRKPDLNVQQGMLRNIVRIISLRLTKSCKLKEFKMGHALQVTSAEPCVLYVLHGTGPSCVLFWGFFS